jgi:hypothetical protein
MRLTDHLYIRLPLLISIALGVVCFFLLPTARDLAKTVDRLEYAGMALSGFYLDPHVDY